MRMRVQLYASEQELTVVGCRPRRHLVYYRVPRRQLACTANMPIIVNTTITTSGISTKGFPSQSPRPICCQHILDARTGAGNLYGDNRILR